MANDEPPSFCVELRDKTKAAHDKSDKLINYRLAVVLTDKKLWAAALADFYFVFQSIEQSVVQTQTHPHVGPLREVIDPKALRAPVFEKDLEYYLGQDWRTQVKPSQAATQYCDRIVQVTSEDPTLLVAYVHSMYLALLAGGQIIKRIVKRTLGVSEKGLGIFDFPKVDRTELRQKLTETINSLELTRSEKDAIIQEKNKVFQMNNSIAICLEPNVESYNRITKFFVAILLFLVMFFYLISQLIG